MPKWFISPLMLLSLTVVNEHGIAAASSWRCPDRPIERCSKHRGRLSSQNGIPRTIWLIGTTRKVNVRNDEVPSFLEKYLEMTSDDHSYVFGLFEICPLEPDTPGQMRAVCVSDAENLVVQNLRKARPPFRLLSTWRREQ